MSIIHISLVILLSSNFHHYFFFSFVCTSSDNILSSELSLAWSLFFPSQSKNLCIFLSILRINLIHVRFIVPTAIIIIFFSIFIILVAHSSPVLRFFKPYCCWEQDNFKTISFLFYYRLQLAILANHQYLCLLHAVDIIFRISIHLNLCMKLLVAPNKTVISIT